MNKKFLRLTSLTLALTLLTGCADAKEADSGASYKSKDTFQTEEFHSMDVKIASGDIEISEGDIFSVSYELHNKEKVEVSQVKDGTLIFTTDIDFKFKPDYGDFFLKITLPFDSELENISLSTVAGDIKIEGRSFNEGIFKTVSGDIEGKELSGSSITSKTTSGEIGFENCNTSSFSANNTSGDISFEGNADKAEAETVAGEIFLKGNIKNKALLKTVSGKIETEISPLSIEAESIGGIEFMGNDQGRKLNLSGGEPKLFASSVSGKIDIK